MSPAADASTVYLAFGSNLGNRVAAIRTGVAALEEDGVVPEEFSSLYHSPPKYVDDQPPFVNVVGRFRTALDPPGLLAACKRAETEAGRQERERYGPRELDVDILLYGSESVDAGGLMIPHPGISERLFVLVPLTEIDPDVEVPGLGSASDLLEEARARLPQAERPVPLGSFEPGRGRALERGI